MLRATLGCSRRRSASSASTRLATRPGDPVGGQPLEHDGVGGERLEVDGRRRLVGVPSGGASTKGWARE